MSKNYPMYRINNKTKTKELKLIIHVKHVHREKKEGVLKPLLDSLITLKTFIIETPCIDFTAMFDFFIYLFSLSASASSLFSSSKLGKAEC